MTRLPSWLAALEAHRLCFRLLVLSIIWAVVFVPRYYFWTIQSRLTLALGDASIIGITADSRELVTCALHTRPSKQYANATESTITGPLSLWNLETGARRTIRLPDELMLPQWDHSSRTPFRVGTSDLVTPALRGRWLQLGCDVVNSGSGFHPAIDANRLVNLDTGDVRTAREREGYFTGMALSQTGRWYVEIESENSSRWNKAPSHVRVKEAATQVEQISFESVHGTTDYRFSYDDQWFAFVDRDDSTHDQGGLLRVWNIKSQELQFSVKGIVGLPEFSRNGTRLAALQWEEEHANVVVFDIAQRKPIREFDMGKRGQPGFMSYGGLWMRFANNDDSLIAMDGAPINWVEAGDGNAIRWENITTFELRTGTRIDLPGSFFDPRSKPCSQGNLDLPPFLLQMIPDRPDAVCNLVTGAVVGQLPFAADSITVSQNGRTMILCPWVENEPPLMLRLAEYLNGKGVPIPQWVWDSLEPNGATPWQVVDVASGRVSGSMPGQSAEHWISPDGTTMLTREGWNSTTGTESTDIHVWDFPPRKSIRPAAMWALIAPTAIALWWWVRRKTSASSNVAT